MRFERLVGLLVVVVLVLAACNRDKDEVSDTSVTPTAGSVTTGSTAPVEGENTGTAAATDEAPTTVVTTPSGEAGSTTTTAPTGAEESGLPNYEVVHRLIEDGRETLVIVVEPGSYSNVELENLVYDIVELYSPSAAIVVDDLAVADLALEEERTDEQQASLDAHTFLTVENGVEVTFYGPYADFPRMTIGS